MRFPCKRTSLYLQLGKNTYITVIMYHCMSTCYLSVVIMITEQAVPSAVAQQVIVKCLTQKKWNLLRFCPDSRVQFSDEMQTRNEADDWSHLKKARKWLKTYHTRRPRKSDSSEFWTNQWSYSGQSMHHSPCICQNCGNKCQYSWNNCHNELNFSKISAHWVPKLPSDEKRKDEFKFQLSSWTILKGKVTHFCIQ